MSGATIEQAVGVLVGMSKCLLPYKHQAMSRPILGGVFGDGSYRMNSHWRVNAGLHAVMYFVTHEESGCVIAMAPAKAGALTNARDLLTVADPVKLSVVLGRARAALHEHAKEVAAQQQVRRDEWQAAQPQVTHIKAIPKRRQKVFDASEGKCHYCGTALTLDGRWHIEHKMPRALLGGSEQHNLVASCVTCNLRKSDMTDLEFQAKLKGVAA